MSGMEMRERRRTTAAVSSTSAAGYGSRTSNDENPSGSGGLVRVTVNLTRRSADSLEVISSATGLSKTDVINRALQVYQVVEELLDKGGGSLLVKHPNGESERVYIV